jgi:hypothetical protein
VQDVHTCVHPVVTTDAMLPWARLPSKGQRLPLAYSMLLHGTSGSRCSCSLSLLQSELLRVESTAAAVAVTWPAHQQRAAGKARSQSLQCFTTRTGGCRTQVTAAMLARHCWGGGGRMARLQQQHALLCWRRAGIQTNSSARSTCHTYCPLRTSPCCRYGVAHPSPANRSLLSASSSTSPLQAGPDGARVSLPQLPEAAMPSIECIENDGLTHARCVRCWVQVLGCTAHPLRPGAAASKVWV